MSLSPSRSAPTRLVVVLLSGLLAAGLLSASAAQAETAAPGRVGGLVLDRANQPVAGATVTLRDSSGAAAASAGTDHDGRWSLALSQGDYDIQVSAQQGGRSVLAKVRGYAVGEDTKVNLIVAGDPDEARTRAAAATQPGPTADVASPTMSRAAAAWTPASSGTVTFSGRVVDADGAPVTSGAALWLSQPDTYHAGDVLVSDDGTFSLEVPAGTYSLRVATDVPEECPGCPYERRVMRDHNYFVNNFRLDGDRAETIRLPRPAVMTVTVVDPSNRPIAGAWVRTATDAWNQPPALPAELFPGATANVYSYVDVLTGQDGTARTEYIPGAGPATISVDPPPGTQLPTSTPFPSNATSLTVQVQDGPTLHGRLLQGDGTPLAVAYAYLSGPSGEYPLAVTDGRYAVTVPPGHYRLFAGVVHNEEGESSDYWIWKLQSEPFQIDGDRALDLNVPLGQARLWVVDDNGERLDDFYTYGVTTTSDIAIADGIRATTRTNSEAWPDDEEYLAVIGPSLTDHLYDLQPYPGAPKSAYVAPGEHTIIAFIAGTGPGYDPLPTTTTTPTTTPGSAAPTTTGPTTTDPVASNDAPAGTASKPARSGYWALASDGTVYHFGEAPQLGNARAEAVDLEPTPSGLGYWLLDHKGRVQAFGDATKLGDVEPGTLTKGEVPASLSGTPSGQGYWVFTNRGRAVPFGDAAFHGDVSAVKLNGPVLGSVATPSGQGYYMVASDGGIFAFGDAKFEGSMGGMKLNQPVQSLVPDSDGKGYWLVASDGGIFAFDAPFKGSLGGVKLNKPVVGMVRYGDGYLMVGADGGIFNFSTLPFSGSLGGKPPASPVVAVAALP